MLWVAPNGRGGQEPVPGHCLGPRTGLFFPPHAVVAELVDALDSGSSARKGLEVQLLSTALSTKARPIRRALFISAGLVRSLLTALLCPEPL